MRTPMRTPAVGGDRLMMEAHNLARLQAGQTPLLVCPPCFQPPHTTCMHQIPRAQTPISPTLTLLDTGRRKPGAAPLRLLGCDPTPIGGQHSAPAGRSGHPSSRGGGPDDPRLGRHTSASHRRRFCHATARRRYTFSNSRSATCLLLYTSPSACKLVSRHIALHIHDAVVLPC